MEREIIASSVTAIYLVGFFVVFFFSTRNGDEFGEVMLLSIMWPVMAVMLPALFVFWLLYRLFEKIKGVSR